MSLSRKSQKTDGTLIFTGMKARQGILLRAKHIQKLEDSLKVMSLIGGDGDNPRGLSLKSTPANYGQLQFQQMLSRMQVMGKAVKR